MGKPINNSFTIWGSQSRLFILASKANQDYFTRRGSESRIVYWLRKKLKYVYKKVLIFVESVIDNRFIGQISIMHIHICQREKGLNHLNKFVLS